MAHYVLYIPGLGDDRWQSQYWFVYLWRVLGVRSEAFKVHWEKTPNFADKFDELLTRIDTLNKAGHRVSLVGVSAGASLALNAFAARPRQVHRVVLLCGKVQRPETVGAELYKHNPAFKTSMAMVKDSLASLGSRDLARITSIHPRQDSFVPVQDTLINGAIEQTIPTKGHGVSILYGISLGAGQIVRAARGGARD